MASVGVIKGNKALQLGLVRYAYALSVLAYASFCDLKTREVSNWVWLLVCPIALVLTIIDIAAGWISVQALILSVALSFALGAVLVYFGLFGGADAKALMFIALTVPTYPAEFSSFLGDPIGLPVLTVFFNSSMLSMICPLIVLTLNVVDVLDGKKPFEGIKTDRLGKIILFLTARRINLDSLSKGLFYFPAETVVEENGKLVRKPVHFVKAEDDLSDLIAVFERNRDLYADGVVASPTIPFIVLLLFGLMLLPFGNLVFWLVKNMPPFMFEGSSMSPVK